jgi:two-component system, OmpR family, sensor histidine kinase KdpD
VFKRLLTELGGYVAGFAIIALITLFHLHEPAFKTTTIVLTYLMAILVASTIWGLGVSLFMTFLASLACDYFFFPPIGVFTIDDPQDWITLFSFALTSLIGSTLSARARRQAAEANQQRNEARRLYKFSQLLLSAQNPLEMLDEIPSLIVETFQARAAALYVSGKQSIHRSGTELPELDEARLRAACDRGDYEIDEERGVCFGPVRLGSQVTGSIGIGGVVFPERTLEALSTLIAAAIDRAQSIERVGKSEAARERERLKSVLLDAIAHDFKTPLTSIKAAATGLLDDLSFTKRQRVLLEVIDEECDRINHVIGEAIEMARLDAGDVTLKLAPHSVDELISAALRDCESLRSTRRIPTEIHPKTACVRCDFFWTKKVLCHLIQNAALYSSPGEPITITAEEKDGHIYFHIADVGPGIDKAEIGQIFGKFYRGESHRHRVPGTGMGLAVSKAIVEAHGGTLDVVSDVGRGSVFTFNLPSDMESKIGVSPRDEIGMNDRP